MRLLLTSAGISNPSIAKAFFDLIGKPPEETSLVFIPTASNIEKGDKSWLIKDLVALKNTGLKSIRIADISAVGENIWRPQVEESDVLFFEGGDTFHLMEWINKSGLGALMPDLLKTKVYVGVSAGSMVACKDMALPISQAIFEEDLDKTEDLAGLGLVDFYVLPHLNSLWFKNMREEFVRKIVEGRPEKVYVLDDDSALKIADGNVEVVSEGKWFAVNG